jgi:uncharacterized membrane protein YfcA
VTHARAGRVDWRIAAWMTPPSVAAAFLGGYFGGRVPETLLLAAIAAALLWNGVQLLLELGAPPRAGTRDSLPSSPERSSGSSAERSA